MKKIKEIKEKLCRQIEVLPETLNEPMALGSIFVKSGMFKDIKSQAEAVVKILAGRELGLAPLESMTNIYMVNGKIALQSKIIASLIKKSQKYTYQVDKLDDAICEISFYDLTKLSKEGKPLKLGESVFSIKDAAKAGIVNKDVWKNYPRNMLFARALSNGARWYTADVYCGYTLEEISNTPPATSVITIDKKGEVTNGK